MVKQSDGWSIHPFIDPILANDKKRKAKSNDPGWEFSWWPDVNDKNTIQCLLCAKVSKSGIKRQKEHLIGGSKNVTKCEKATPMIREKMIKWKKVRLKRRPDVYITPTPINEMLESSASCGTPNVKKPLVIREEEIVAFIKERDAEGKKQIRTEDPIKKQVKKMVDEYFTDLVYDCGLPFDFGEQLSAKVLCEALGRYGPGYIPPSPGRTREILLERGYTCGHKEFSTPYRTYQQRENGSSLRKNENTKIDHEDKVSFLEFEGEFDLMDGEDYQCGLPFDFGDQFSLEVFCEAVGRYGPGYIPPSSRRVREILLERGFTDGHRDLDLSTPYRTYQQRENGSSLRKNENMKTDHEDKVSFRGSEDEFDLMDGEESDW